MRLFSLLAFIMVGACAHDIEPTQQDAAALATLMIGTFETAPDDRENNFRDERVALSPLGPGEWIFYQLNTGPERKLYRQRVIQLTDLKDGEVLQETYSFVSPADFDDFLGNTEKQAALSGNDIEQMLNSACELVWRYSPESGGGTWIGIVDKEKCKIFSERRQAFIFIGSESRLGNKTFYQSEKGFDENGVQLFGNPEGEFIILYRQ